MEEIGKLYDRVGHMIEESEERTMQHIKDSEEQTKLHFDVVSENMRHDFLGAHKDRIENHENRIHRLEDHVGLVAL